MQMKTLTANRTTAPGFHGFSGSWLVFNALSKSIAGSYSTPIGVTRKFLLPNGQSRFIVAG